jgi:hypothetical protein
LIANGHAEIAEREIWSTALRAVRDLKPTLVVE